ncbi:MAG: hypothetical protein QM758_18310 [Armatimonas sp.]
MKRMVLLTMLAALGLAASAQELKVQGQLQTQRPPVAVDKNKLKDVLKIAIPHPIVFSRTGDQKGLWKREIDGTETRLSSGEDTSPASYTDGRIYFTRRTSNGTSTNIWSMKRDGSDERQEITDGYSPQPYASVLAFIRREPGDLGKVWLMVKVGNELKKVASAGWVARGYYISRPVFEPGTSRIIAGSYEKDDGGAKPKVWVRAYNFNGTYDQLWSGVADGVAGLAVYKEGSTVHRLGILSPEGQNTDIWKLDGGAGSAKLIADPDAEASLDATSVGKLLIGVGGKLYMANKTGSGRIFVADGYNGIWLD